MAVTDDPDFLDIAAADDDVTAAAADTAVPEDETVCTSDAVLNGEKLNFLAMAAAGILATKLTTRQRTVLSLFLATVSTSLANITFADESLRKQSKAGAAGTENTAKKPRKPC